MSGLMEMFSSPEFWTHFGNVGGGLSRAGRGQGFDISQGNAQVMNMIRERQSKQKLGGLMENLDLNQQQREFLGALPVGMQQQVLARHMFPQGQDPTSGMQEYQLYREQALQSGQQPMDFLTYKQSIGKAGATNVNVNAGSANPQAQFGKIPQGWGYFPDGQGGYMAKPVPGGPAAIEAQEAAGQDAKRREGKAVQSDIVLQNLDQIISDPPEWSTGFSGARLGSIEGTPAYDLRRQVDTIKASVGFDKLQAMREASPTGGALGQVSEMENRLLQSVLGSLDPNQSNEAFMANIKRLRDIYSLMFLKEQQMPPEQYRREMDALAKRNGIQLSQETAPQSQGGGLQGMSTDELLKLYQGQ